MSSRTALSSGLETFSLSDAFSRIRSVACASFVQGSPTLVASQILCGILAAGVLVGCILEGVEVNRFAFAALAIFLSPVAIGLFLARTRRFDIAYLLSAIHLAAIIGLGAALSGGHSSFAVAWLVLVPLEAGLSGRLDFMGIATAAAATVFIVLASVPSAWLAEPSGHEAIALVANAMAIAYGGVLVAQVVRRQRDDAREIELSRAHYCLIAENANDLITVHDAGGAATFGSLASLRLLGVAPERLIGEGFFATIGDVNAGICRRAIVRCSESREPTSVEYRLPLGADSAKAVWLEMRCQPVQPGAESGSAPSVIAVTRDITQRKAELNEVEKARADAEAVSRSKSAFLAMISHELRTPLSAIIGFSELLHRELLTKVQEPKYADYCQSIRDSGEHLLALVKDLLDVSKIEAGKLTIEPEPFPLRDLVKQTVSTFETQAASRGVALAADIDAGLPDLLADRRATRQILLNLMSNALKFTPEGGRIDIGARLVGSMIEISVQDTGAGISTEHLRRLAQPFYQVENSYSRRSEGAGLGLSIVRGLASLHGGELKIESVPGEGSRFSVYLPCDLGADSEKAADQSHGPTADVTGFAQIFDRGLEIQNDGQATDFAARSMRPVPGPAG